MKNIIIILSILAIFINNSFSTEITQREINILKNLRCLVCQGQSIADSNSDFAQTIKLVVKDEIRSGKAEKDIYEFLIKKYGEWIVYKPSFSKVNILLWLLPYLALIFGAAIIFKIVRKNNKN